MKKCAVVYTDNDTGEQFWACSFDENGATYRLVKRTTPFPQSHHEATEFYGKDRLKQAQKLIDKDLKFNKLWTYSRTAEVIEYDRAPDWYFEIQYVLSKAYNDKPYSPVRKGFMLNPEVEYSTDRPASDRPLITDLPLEELERYYEWRKQNFKGIVREV